MRSRERARKRANYAKQRECRGAQWRRGKATRRREDETRIDKRRHSGAQRTRNGGTRLVDGLSVLQVVGLGHLLEEGGAVDLLDGDVLNLRSRLVDGLGVLEGGTLADGGLKLGVHVG